MKDKKRTELINNTQKDINEYWFNVTADDIITIRTRAFNGPYVRREAEKFTAIKLPDRDIPGLGRSIRCIPLNQNEVSIQNIALDWIQSVDGKAIRQQTEWQIKDYTVKLKGDNYTCTCKGYMYAKKSNKTCKHIKQIQDDAF